MRKELFNKARLYTWHAVIGATLIILDEQASRHQGKIESHDIRAEAGVAIGNTMMTQSVVYFSAVMVAHWDKIPMISDEIRPVMGMLALLAAGVMGFGIQTMHASKGLAESHDTREKLEMEYLIAIADMILVIYSCVLVLMESKIHPIRARKTEPAAGTPYEEFEINEIPRAETESPATDGEGADDPIELSDIEIDLDEVDENDPQEQPLHPSPARYGVFGTDEGSPRRRSPRRGTLSNSPSNIVRRSPRIAWAENNGTAAQDDNPRNEATTNVARQLWPT